MSEFLLTLDTNVLLYSVDQDAGVKQYQALEVIERAALEQTGVLTLQALAEFYFAAVRKAKMPADDARAQVEDWQILFPTIVPSTQTLANALKVVHEHNIQFWDAMLWAVAKENGVKILLSEDFQHGRVLGGVRFVNPFLEVAGVAEPSADYTP
jgi:predicted nucleic acid-binding protein